MKKLLLGTILGVGLTASIAFTAAHYDAKNSTAEVESMNNVLLFVSSKPVQQYDYLGTVEISGVVLSKEYEAIVPKIVEKALKKYPNAQGLVFKEGKVYKADVIKFKQ
jgi:hypothetical protein